MRRPAITFATGILLSIVGLAAIAIGGPHRSRQRPITFDPSPDMIKPIPRGLTPAVNPAPTARRIPSFTASPSPDVKGEILKLHRQAAKLLTNANPIPPHRLAHFRWIATTPDCELVDWGGFIEELQPVPGGYLAIVRVSPVITFRRASAVTMDSTVETYSLRNGQVELLAVVDPLDAVPGVALTD